MGHTTHAKVNNAMSKKKRSIICLSLLVGGLLVIWVSHVSLDEFYGPKGSFIRMVSQLEGISAGEATPEQWLLSQSEFRQFKKLIGQTPVDKPKAALYFLVQPKRKNMKMLLKLLKQLEVFFLDRFQYPLIIFHESDMTPPLIAAFRDIFRNTTINLFFQLIEIKIPDFVAKPVPKVIKCQKSISYRNMCRFHAKLVYEQPVMKEIDYYWRLDDDSQINNKINYDVFWFMKNAGIMYGYRTYLHESGACVENFHENVTEYIIRNQLNDEGYRQTPFNTYFYNNFEISKVSFWLSDQYQSYVDFIDRAGGIYHHRWGDAIIKSVAVVLFLKVKEVHEFFDIDYLHQGLPRCNQMMIYHGTCGNNLEALWRSDVFS